MAQADQPHESRATIDNETGVVDQRLKQQLIEDRQRIGETKLEFIGAAKLGDIEMDKAVAVWGDQVREYLMKLEPVLKQDAFGLSGAEEVYKEVDLGKMRIQPPEELRQSGREMAQNGSDIVLIGEPPSPKTATITGLEEVIRKEVVSASWEVTLQETSSDSQQPETRSISKEVMINRSILQNAVREADEWRQSIGLGLDIDEGMDRDHI